jgi:serpin B
MSVVLPEGDLSTLEAGLTGERLGRLLAAASSEGLVAVQLPRWRLRLASPLNDILGAMGMPNAFDPGAADFSGMTAAMQLCVAAVLHEAFIAVDEDGTEAAAAAAVVIRPVSVRVPERDFVADRPFLFVVHDTDTLTPLFVGRVVDPTA